LLRYTIGLGFLDGVEGLIFHFLQGFWYRFLVDAKLYAHDREIKQSSMQEELLSSVESGSRVASN
ncbi:MAG: glycosyltransferase family 2 protein, partial [Cyanobacteria bacterium J06626_26]